VSKLLQRLEGEIQLRCRLGRGGTILAAVSGGLDSMTLLRVLHSLAGKWRWKIVVAHFNHQLRGRSSDADEKLVRKTAAILELPFVAGRADVKQFAQQSKISVEMAARKLRHEFFARVAGERNISTVALAHHADDQVELFFLRVLRGAGGEGLAGMKRRSPSPVNSKIMLVRPLLGCSKTEILAFARGNKIPFREDATNASNDVFRNRLRNELLPLLRNHYQPGVTKTVLRLMEIVGAEAEMVGQVAENWLRRRRPDFGALSVAVQRRVLQLQLEQLNVGADFDLVEHLRESAGQFVSIGSRFSISRSPDGGLKLRAQPSLRFSPNELHVNLTGRAGDAEFAGAILSWRLDPGKKGGRPRKKSGCEYFDATRVGGKIILRHWRPGDRFQPIGLRAAAKLQDLFTNAKIPRDRRRDLIVAAAADGELFWVEGLRISENFKLTVGTVRRLVWHWHRRKRRMSPDDGILPPSKPG
jgi:tRNA(Ile)-lysidine synthase